MPEPSTRAQWAELLAEFERRAVDAPRSDPSPWSPPRQGPPLPAELAERAAAVLAAQNRTIAQLQAQEQKLRSQLRALDKLPQAFHGDTPVYVDAIG